ncbi:MAG: hypothetical protein IVW36_12240 [Dehalococcoidia bacterium]|nr:hypothetical protein [Dehalococcoidia bacterium]
MTLATQRRPLQPFRLTWLFARSLACAAIIAAALYAALYVASDMRDRSATQPPAPAAPDVQLPDGFELLTPLADAAAFEQALGFAPVVPATLPAGSDSRPRFDATQPDATGVRSGELRFTARRDAAGAPRGPSLLLIESRPARPAAEAPLRAIGAGSSEATARCGATTITARFYFAGAVDDSAAAAVAQRFLDALRSQCAS